MCSGYLLRCGPAGLGPPRPRALGRYPGHSLVCCIAGAPPRREPAPVAACPAGGRCRASVCCRVWTATGAVAVGPASHDGPDSQAATWAAGAARRIASSALLSPGPAGAGPAVTPQSVGQLQAGPAPHCQPALRATPDRGSFKLGLPPDRPGTARASGSSQPPASHGPFGGPVPFPTHAGWGTVLTGTGPVPAAGSGLGWAGSARHHPLNTILEPRLGPQCSTGTHRSK